MEDLVPLLIFVVIAVANLLKFAADKGRKKKQTPPLDGKAPSKRQPSTLEKFFEEIAEKLEPQPPEPSDWPESRERPDYMGEMAEFQHAQAEAFKEETAEILPMPPPEPDPVSASWKDVADAPEVQVGAQATSLKSAMKSMPAMLTHSKGMRMTSAPLLRSSSAGHINFPLKERSVLRKALIANIIFSAPRVYDRSFDNAIVK